jgi:hypothetical protein
MGTRRNGLAALLAAAAIGVASLSNGGQAKPPGATTMKIAPDIEERRAQFVQQNISVDLRGLSKADRSALDSLVAAAKLMDRLFLIQAWHGNPTILSRLVSLNGPLAQPARDYYRIMAGPWDRLKDFEPFLGEAKHPVGAGFYPENLTKADLEAWVAAHPADKAAFDSPFTVIIRKEGGLAAVPYSIAYADVLGKAAVELRAAAAATKNESLKKFLTLRADAFSSNDYFASDMAWMDLDSPIEVVIGPYETYEDGLQGFKAAFEAFICIEQPAESERLAKYKQELPYLESRLPIPAEHRNTKRGFESPIRVADNVITGGDARRGIQTLAFNLPNDERVREAKGSKKVLLRNMMKAKFDGILVPIAKLALPAEDLEKVQFESYFHFVLFHELCHGLGPGRITVAGRQTEVRAELKELYAAIEEAKADVLGAFTLEELAAKKVVAPEVTAALPWTYLAGLFRSVRFGATDAHGRGVALQAGYLMGKGAIEVTANGQFRPNLKRFNGAIKELAHDLLMVEAEGSHAKAEAMLKRYGTVPPAMTAILSKLGSVPVDVDPVYEADWW